MKTLVHRLWLVAGLLLASACASEDSATVERERDPAIVAALNDPIMIDPDLVGQNRANSAAAMPSFDASVPSIDRNPEAISAARGEAVRLIGGAGKMRRAPAPRDSDGRLPAAALTAAARVTTSPRSQADCTAQVRYTARWAARLPAPFPVYPRGAVQEAAGTDASGCALRVVNFVTPVPLGDVIDFYYTRAEAAGFSTERLLRDGDDILAGARAEASFVIYARRLPSGNTEVDLVTSG